MAIGVNKHALGCWIEDIEERSFGKRWASTLRDRGGRDIPIACCDRITGLLDAIRSISSALYSDLIHSQWSGRGGLGGTRAIPVTAYARRIAFEAHMQTCWAGVAGIACASCTAQGGWSIG